MGALTVALLALALLLVDRASKSPHGSDEELMLVDDAAAALPGRDVGCMIDGARSDEGA